MSIVEQGGKAVGGVLEIMRAQPLVLMMGLMNAGLLVFLWLYMSRITERTEHTVAALFGANDKLYTQWGKIVADTSELAEKSLHCITVDDAIKLLSAPKAAPLAFPPLTLPPLRLLRETHGG